MPEDGNPIEFQDLSRSHPFMKIGLNTLSGLKEQLRELDSTLRDIEVLSKGSGERQITRLKSGLRNFEPSVTMIGQIKSGKTSLVNAMVGRPGLLPADVNPWTSVVTSLHMNPPPDPDRPAVSFKFFGGDEWDHLVSSGGRIGELSERAGAEDELQKFHAQIAAMREKSRKRLGRRFELLLGQQHDYSHLDDALMQRYVCLGDDFDDISVEEQQGHFADITKSADLYLSSAALPMALCLRDTPGVNDTFLMREQITIKALRDSRLCVVVLAASQALSSVDVGLVRLISNVKSDGLVIFVNRIDELSDPVNQMPEIRKSITATLDRLKGPQEPEIIFGSALWANAALSEDPSDIDEDSAEALHKCAAATLKDKTAEIGERETMWRLSGVPTLYEVLADRISQGPGARLLNDTRKKASNHVSGLRAATELASMRIDGNSIQVMEPTSLDALLKGVEAKAMKRLSDDLNRVFAQFEVRVNQSHRRFLDRALESLLNHLEVHGEREVWQYNADGLRMLLRTSYHVLRTNLTSACSKAYGAAAEDVTRAFVEAVGVSADGFTVSPPTPPEVPAPVSLGATIALDLHSSWWRGWWKRRKGYRSYAESYAKLIVAETAPFIEELQVRQAQELRALATDQMVTFLEDQRAILMDICTKAQISLTDLNNLFGITSQKERSEVLDVLFEELNAPLVSVAEGSGRSGNTGEAA